MMTGIKGVTVLGSTGSIGCNVAEILSRFPERYRAVALCGATNTSLLAAQVRTLRPELAVVQTKDHARALEAELDGFPVRILFGDAGYHEAATHKAADVVVSSIVGGAGLKPTVAAIRAKKTIALANKESLVMAGDFVMALAKGNGVEILPVDSEHSAIFQSLSGQRKRDVDHLLLTASGGPFRTRDAATFEAIRPEDALAHPTWSMGRKISIDSATLMNKGLEVIEAMHLFSVPAEKIRVVVHPQSVVHSMVAYQDGTVISQMGIPDMKGAIALALSWPERLPLDLPLPDFSALDLSFESPDLDRFPCLKLAFRAAETGGLMPAILNGANEIAVARFLGETIPFTGISQVIESTMDALEDLAAQPADSLETVLMADATARKTAADIATRLALPAN